MAVLLEASDLLVSTIARNWLSRTSGDDNSVSLCPAIAGFIGHATLMTRALSNRNPARPYICLLIAFSRFT